MSWNDLCQHPYITMNPSDEAADEQLHLSYSDNSGYYQRDDIGKMDESAFLNRDPHNYLNEKNAILLNCKNPQLYNDVYLKTLEKHYQK